jgi:hypothetical protein
MYKQMRSETAHLNVAQENSEIVERLDQLLLELRRLNKGNRQQKAAMIRVNQETRVMLEQIQAELTAV